MSVRGSDQDSVTANLRALRRQRLGVVDVIAADEAVVHDDNRQPSLAVITNNRPRVQWVMGLGGEPFVERANHLHRPLPGRDVHLRRARAKFRPRVGGNEEQGEDEFGFQFIVLHVY